MNAQVVRTATPQPGEAPVDYGDRRAVWDRVDAILAVDRGRVATFAARRRATQGAGAVVVRLDEPAGSRLAWLRYDPKALARLGVHSSHGLGMILREITREVRPSTQPVVFVDSAGRKVLDVYWRLGGREAARG